MTRNPPTSDLDVRLEQPPQVSNAYLRRYMTPFVEYFERFKEEGLIEVVVNRPGEIWIETHAHGWRCISDERLTVQDLDFFAKNLALAQNQAYDKDKTPFLYTSLPGWGYRGALVGRAVAESGFALSMRVSLARTFPLTDYFGDRSAEQVQAMCQVDKPQADMSSYQGLLDAIRDGINLVVAGGTNSGKTTFINSVIGNIPNDSRVIVIEDTAEVHVPQPNHVRLLKSKTGTDLAQVSWADMLNVCMRLRPDRIILGELDTGNVELFLRILNTGHKGCITTLHAEAPELVHEALVTNICMHNRNANRDEYMKYARKVIKDVVFLEGCPRTGIRARHVKFD